MGYKLAGFHHLGGVELDPRVAEIYNANHHPQYLYNMDIRDFNKLQDLPDDLYNLDLLDGSPPCSTFSTAGSRDKAWGKEKKFAEGQKKQTLDDLVFVYCDTILKLQPKCFLLENVSGLVKGNAKSYAKRIVQYMEQNGYVVQVFLLNAAQMGVPQKRERVFFIGRKKELRLPNLVLDFNEEPIHYRMFEDDDCSNHVVPCDDAVFDQVPPGHNFSFVKPNWRFNSIKLHPDMVPNTIASSNGSCLYHYKLHKRLSNRELRICGTFPLDYDFADKDPQWFIGMSVPPVMTAQIAYQIYKQWLSKINK
jgi:DNA (cytosine-5)-methyltransferase 1